MTSALRSTAINLRRAILSDAAVQHCVYAAFAPYIERMGKAPAPMGMTTGA